MGQIKDINDLVNATFQVKKFFKDTKKKYNLNYEEIYILNYKYKYCNLLINYNIIIVCHVYS